MDKYPRITFRLSTEDYDRVAVLARIRCRSRAQVIREAIGIYFRAMIAPQDS